MPAGRKLPPTREGEVESIDWRNLNALDRVARFVLALAYSDVQDQGKAQEYAGANTVAIARSTREPKKLYVAYNSLWMQWNQDRAQRGAFDRQTVKMALANVRSELGAELGVSDPTLVWVNNWQKNYTQRRYHAEMQLVDFFGNKKLEFADGVIGCSKACCTPCASALDKLGLHYSYWHDRQVNSDWQPPRYDKRWW